LPDSRLILDVGANHGDFASAASAFYPKSKVWLFEPLSQLHAELRLRSQAHEDRWRLFPQALGAERAALQLHIDPLHDDVASLVGFHDTYLTNNPKAEYVPGKAPDEIKKRRAEIQSCEVIPLDDLAGEFPEEKIDLLKIDVEGFEFEALAGATKTLKRTQAAIIEVSLVRAGDRDGSRLIRMLDLLENAGLTALEILPYWFSKTEPWLPMEFNILARRSD